MMWASNFCEIIEETHCYILYNFAPVRMFFIKKYCYALCFFDFFLKKLDTEWYLIILFHE